MFEGFLGNTIVERGKKQFSVLSDWIGNFVTDEYFFFEFV